MITAHLVTIEQLCDKYPVEKSTVRRAMTREDLIRGEHFSADTGTMTVFDEAKTVQRLQELNILNPSPKLL